MKRFAYLIMILALIGIMMMGGACSKEQTSKVNTDSIVAATQNDRRYAGVPKEVKDHYWKSAEDYAYGMEAENYNWAVIDYYNGAMTAYIESREE